MTEEKVPEVPRHSGTVDGKPLDTTTGRPPTETTDAPVEVVEEYVEETTTETITETVTEEVVSDDDAADDS